MVSAGAAIQVLGAILDTVPCHGAPNPATCDDQYGFSTGPDRQGNVYYDIIIAGANGIAETEVNRDSFDLKINSAWRNPEQNEAVGGVVNSRHQLGEAVDIDFYEFDDGQPRPEGKTKPQFFCTLFTAAEQVSGVQLVLAEQNRLKRICDQSVVTHIHVNK